jgi:hypothetical protein
MELIKKQESISNENSHVYNQNEHLRLLNALYDSMNTLKDNEYFIFNFTQNEVLILLINKKNF